MKKNTYFESMRQTAINYNEAKAERDEERRSLIKANDWDGVKAWDEREKKEFPYPFTQGANKALIEYDCSLSNGADYFEVRDLPWDKELPDFVKTLQLAGIDTIVITDQSTGLMDGIYGLTALGCEMIGLQKVTRADDHRFGSKEPEVKNGIEMEIPEYEEQFPIDRTNLDGKMGATAEPIDWDDLELSDKAQLGLRYLEGAAFLFKYEGKYVVTDEGGDLKECGDGSRENPYGFPQGEFDSLDEINPWLEEVVDENMDLIEEMGLA